MAPDPNRAPPPDGERRPSSAPDDVGTGEEAARILSEVMEDQRRKKARQEAASGRKPRNDGRKAIVAAGLALVLLILMAARPDFLRPEPLPEPSRALVEAGLRIDMYGTALQVRRYREREGRLPESLEGAVEDADTDLRYTRLASGYYLVGSRAGVEIVHRSGESLDALLADAREVIRRGGRGGASGSGRGSS